MITARYGDMRHLFIYDGCNNFWLLIAGRSTGCLKTASCPTARASDGWWVIVGDDGFCLSRVISCPGFFFFQLCVLQGITWEMRWNGPGFDPPSLFLSLGQCQYQCIFAIWWCFSDAMSSCYLIIQYILTRWRCAGVTLCSYFTTSLTVKLKVFKSLNCLNIWFHWRL